jgi:hypothetical protein
MSVFIGISAFMVAIVLNVVYACFFIKHGERLEFIKGRTPPELIAVIILSAFGCFFMSLLFLGALAFGAKHLFDFSPTDHQRNIALAVTYPIAFGACLFTWIKQNSN